MTMAIASFYENKYSSKDEDDYWSEKALHEAAKRKLAELELARRQNLSHDAADVERVMTDMLSKLLSFWAYQQRWLLDWRIRAEVLL